MPPVAATAGGKFDPDAGWLYFAATNPSGHSGLDLPNVLVAVNEIKSKRSEAILARLCEERTVMLDSGIYALASEHARKHGVSHDVGLSLPPEEIDGFDRLWDRYADLATRFAPLLWGVVELDQGGIEHKPRTRARIESELGFTPIPVYHPLLDGWDYYDDLARGYDRLCFGNLVAGTPPLRTRLIHTAAVRARAYPHLWTHLLGVTPGVANLACPMRGSCDSSSWLSAVRWHPSWQVFGMLAPLGGYPRDMWPGSGRPGADRAVGTELAAALVLSTARTYTAIREDTHP